MQQPSEGDPSAEEWARKLATINKRVIVERKFQAPWSTAGVEAMHQHSVSQEALSVGVNVRNTFHHYYKKHMTLLGLRKELDSSDTDSETSDNYQAKLFRRRQHRLKPRAMGSLEDAEHARRKALKGQPWSYRCPSFDDIGIQNVERVMRGKKTVGFPTREQMSALRERDAHQWMQRANSLGRKTPLVRLQEAIDNSRGERSMFRNEWDGREEEEQQTLRRRRHEFRSLPAAPTPVERAKERMQRAKAEEAERASTRRDRGAKVRSLSSMTTWTMSHELHRIRKDHAESMARHKMVMDCVNRIPILQCQ